MNVGIIGAGLIGGKRAEALNRLKDLKLNSVADLDIQRARVLSEKFGGVFTNSWREVVTSSEISFIIICTQHDIAVEIAIEALKNGKHVLKTSRTQCRRS